MKIYKLSAISSTNTYLKDLLSVEKVTNFTVVSTEFQTLGKGQMAAKWHSKKSKNLLFSILANHRILAISNQAYLNFAVSIAIYNVLQRLLPKVTIKWPNDIMSHNKKICGILIENSVKNGSIKYSIIGVGLNVNQLVFPNSIPNATSLKKELKHSFNRNLLLEKLISSIQKQVALLYETSFLALKNTYESVLYKKKKPTMFKNLAGITFLGRITGVTSAGLLLIELPDGTTKTFAVKEIFIL